MLHERVNPTDLQWMSDEAGAPAELALDTETSGLYVDAGARAATVSIAWVDTDGEWGKLIKPGQHVWEGGIVTYLPEDLGAGRTEWVLSMAWPIDQGIDGTGKDEDDGQGALWIETENHGVKGWQALVGWLKGEYIGLVMHHAKFDCHILAAGLRGAEQRTAYPEAIEQVVWDTQNVTSLIWGMHGTTGLKPTATRVFNQDVQDEQKLVKQYLKNKKLPSGRWDLLPWSVIARYADMDARLTIRLREAQKVEVEKDAAVAELARRRLWTTNMLFKMERRGLPFDAHQARKTSESLKEVAENMRQRLPFQPATLPMAKHYWFGEGVKNGVEGQGLTPSAVTESGQPKLDQTVMRELVAKGVDGAKEWAELNKAVTADARWYEGWSELAGPDGKLRGTVRQNGTRSGRFSIERVQLQAIPQDYRLEGFEVLEGLPTPRTLIGAGVKRGSALWELDLANAELRVAAMYAGCKRMLELIGAGADLHGQTAKDLFEWVDEDSPQWKKYRTIAKRANFSLIFGVGWAKLQDDIYTQTGEAMTDYQAKELVEGWNALYPEYRKAINQAMGRVEERQRKHGYGWIKMSNGEKRWFTGDEDAHKAFNQRVQGNLAQFGIDWWLSSVQAIDRELRAGDWGPDVETNGHGLVMLIHDSMVLHLPTRDRIDERIVKKVKQTGEELWKRWFPQVPGGVDPEIWAKPE